MNIDLVASRRWFFIVSGGMALIALIVLAIPPTLRPGIEFTSGTTESIHFQKPVDEAKLRAVYTELGHPEARIQSSSRDGQPVMGTGRSRMPNPCPPFAKICISAGMRAGQVHLGFIR